MAASISMCSRLHLGGRSVFMAKCLFKRIQRRQLVTKTVVEPRGEEHVKKDVTLKTEQSSEYRTFEAIQTERLEQAERSVLISCPKKLNEKKVLAYLSKHGDINKCFFYENYGIYAVVEYANKDSIASLHKGTAIPDVNHESMVPFKSRLLSLRSLGPADTPKSSKDPVQFQPQTAIPVNELVQKLSREETIGHQISALRNAYQLTEENTRLRFLVCSLLKDIAAAYFPECTVRPFGSSVNGLGRLGCDLDMFLDLDGISGRNMTLPKAGFFLEYQMKQDNSERAVTQNILSVIGDCVNHFGAGCVGVMKIMNARCPLVRFVHQPSGFQCDLTANNRVAMKSTELLYLYGELDDRVRPLVLAVRCWARAQGITSSIPGAWVTNFSLTVMVLFFLQRRSTPVIPTLDHLAGLAGPADMSVIEGNDCTFVSDITRIRKLGNTETPEQLLCDFFEFYATFPFNEKSINIRKGKEQHKPEAAPLHIQNPFEPSLNVSKNVNVAQLGRFVMLCQESSWQLQEEEGNRVPPVAGGAKATTPWGLASLILPSKHGAAAKETKGSRKWRRQPASERIKDLLQSLKKKS